MTTRSPRRPTDLKVASHEFRAWSCTVRLVISEQRLLAPAVRDLEVLLAKVDKLASRFRADSALSIANANAGKPVPIPKLLVDMIGAALSAASRTEGAVDPTVGRMMDRIGYDRDIADVAWDGPAIVSDLPGRTWRDVRLYREAGLVTVPVGTALDLGATAKAFTADLAARTLHRAFGANVMVELGGDLAVTGDLGSGWPIQVAEYEGGRGQVVMLRHGGLTTSTTTVRRWRRGGQDAHHIVDPRTGLPADGPWRTATVYAPSALAANTASTAAIVLGERALPWLESQHLAARLVRHDDVVMTTAGWPAAKRDAA